jgi:hypothetical protein
MNAAGTVLSSDIDSINCGNSTHTNDSSMKLFIMTTYGWGRDIIGTAALMCKWEIFSLTCHLNGIITVQFICFSLPDRDSLARS